MRRALAFLLLFSACATVPPPPSSDNDDTRKTIEELRNAIAANPEDGPRIYVLAQFLDRVGDRAEAMKWLGELERIGWTHGVNDHDFLHSLSSREYRALASRLDEREPKMVRSTRAFVIAQPDLVPEGIAFDPTTGDFYVSSIYRRKIVRISREGKSSDFVREGQDGIFSTLGMKVDVKRRLLWAVSHAAQEMNGYSGAVDGQSAIFAYDLSTGALVTKVTFGSSEVPSLLNDLVLLEDGSVLITDSDGGGIMRVRFGSDIIEAFLPPDTFTFPNGIALSDGEPYLYVADFNGISRVDLRSRTVTPLPVPERHETLSGIDGLAWYGGALIGIQNGVGRPRVIRIALNDSRDAVTEVKVLEASNPQFDEPTTGAIADGSFYFLANPQLRAFDENHRIWPLDKLRDVVVLRLPLD